MSVSKSLSVALFSVLQKTKSEKGVLKSHCLSFLKTLGKRDGWVLSLLVCFTFSEILLLYGK